MRRLRRWIPAASCLEQVRETGGNSCDNIAVIANALAGRKCFSDIPAPSLIGATQKVGAFSQPKGNSKFDENGRIRCVGEFGVVWYTHVRLCFLYKGFAQEL